MIRPLSRFNLALDIIGAGFLLLIMLPLSLATYAPPFPMSGTGASDTAAMVGLVIAAVLMCGGLAIGRLSPLLALIAAWAGAIVQMAFGLSPLPIDVAVIGVLYATAAWGSRKVLWAGLISVGAGSVIAGTYIVLINKIEFYGGLSYAGLAGFLFISFTFFALGLGWVSGLAWRMVLRSRRIKKDQLRAEAAAAQEQERVRIARDMHDIVAHSLAVVIAQADGARYAAAVNPEVATQALGTIAQTARGALSDVRLLLTQLRHQEGAGPQPTLADLDALFAQVGQAGVQPSVTVDPMPASDPPGAIQLAVYRILQEALTNAIRHGDGGPVDVRISWFADRVDIEIRNAVRADAEQGTGGHGLVGMSERAALVGGNLQIDRARERFIVRASLPIGASE